MIKTVLSVLLCLLLAFSPEAGYAQALVLPVPGSVVGASAAFVPMIFKGLTVHPENPLLFDFIVDTGDSGLKPGTDDAAIRAQSNTMVKYFMASLTLPEKDQWVNLSPFEKDRILPEQLGKTELGRDMLAEDYLLKQVTASFIHPDTDLGRTFWAKVYSRAQKELGVADIPVDTFNKVWVSADKADVFVHDNTAFVAGSHLKVQLEADYLAATQVSAVTAPAAGMDPVAGLSKKLIREIILPELEKEVNNGKNFARLRQIFHAMILATWYKKNLKQALLTQVYADRSKMSGVEGAWVAHQGADVDPAQIWSRYEAAYKQGVFNLIKEDIDQATGEPLPRKYFAGGLQGLNRADKTEAINDAASIPTGAVVKVVVDMGNADHADKGKKLLPAATDSELLQEEQAFLEKRLHSALVQPITSMLVISDAEKHDPEGVSDAVLGEQLEDLILHMLVFQKDVQVRLIKDQQHVPEITIDPVSGKVINTDKKIQRTFYSIQFDGIIKKEMISIWLHGARDYIASLPLQKADNISSEVVTMQDLIKRDSTLKVATDADKISNWVSPHGESLAVILDNIIKEYDIRGLDGGDDENFPTQIDATLWRWLGRALGSVPFTSPMHERTAALQPGDFYLIAGDNGPSTGGQGAMYDKRGNLLPNVIDAMSQGLMDAGIHVINLNIVGSGALYSSVATLMEELKKSPVKFKNILKNEGLNLTDEEINNLTRIKGGVYITRSHVEVGTNGAKPNVDGITLYAEMLQAMKPYIQNGVYREVAPDKRGKMLKDNWIREVALDLYEQSIKAEFLDLKTSLDDVARLAEAAGKKAPKVVLNFSGGSMAATEREDKTKFYSKLASDLLEGHLKEILREDSDPWNENGGLADTTRPGPEALSHPKADIIKFSQDNPDDYYLIYDLDIDRIAVLQNGRLFLGDEMFYPVIEYQLTLDPYKEIHRQSVPILFDSRMKSELPVKAVMHGGKARLHPKGHSKVKASIDVIFSKLVKAWGKKNGNPNATKEDFLNAHPGFSIVQAEYSTHMFKTDTYGNAFDDAVRFGFFWIQSFAKVLIAKKKFMTMAEYIQADKDAPENPLPDSKQLKEQRTSVSYIDAEGRKIPANAETKKALIYRMTDKVETYFQNRQDFEYINSEDYRREKIFTLVNVDGVYHLFIDKPGFVGEVFWGWSNTSNKIAIGTQSPDTEVNKKLAEFAVALLVDSRKEIAQETRLNLIGIEDIETLGLRDLLKKKNAVEVERDVTGEYPNAVAAIKGVLDNSAVGGIDLNAANMAMSERGDTVAMRFDPAMIAQFKRGDFTGIKPEIIQITPVPSLAVLMGLTG